MQEQVTDQLLRVAQDCDNITQAVREVIIADENTDITLTDGTTTPSLSKRVKQWGGQVTKVVDKVGDVTAEDIANALELGTASKQNTSDLMRAVNLSDESGLNQQQVSNGLGSIKDLLLLDNPKNGNRQYVKSYWQGNGVGGNTFIYDTNMPKSRHNGGTIIDPLKSWDGTREAWASVAGYLPDVGVGVWGVDDESKVTSEIKSAIIARGGNLTLSDSLNPTNFRTNQIKLGGFLGASTNGGMGCWVAQTKEYRFTMFGAKGDASKDTDGTDDSFAMLACVRALPKTGAILSLENLYYTHGNGDIRNIVLHFMNFNKLIIKGNLATIQSHSNNLSTVSTAITRFDYCSNVVVSCLNTDGKLGTRMVVGGDPNTNNDQMNFHIGLGCKDFTFFKCSADRAIMDGFYIYGWGDSGNSSTQNITFIDCKAQYCYRQGSSHIEGLNIRYIGGSYSYTGQLPNPSGGTKGTAPMSGIDIESNNDTYASRATFTCDGVEFRGNKKKGFIFSKNAYGSVTNCTFIDNAYMGCYIGHNAMNAIVRGCRFTNNVNSIYNEVGATALITDNDIYDASNGINVVYRTDAGLKPYSSTRIVGNRFTTPKDMPQGKSISADYGAVEITDNIFTNVAPIWLGGDANWFAKVNKNTFTNTNPAVTSFLNTWTGSRLKELSNNTVNLAAPTPLLMSTNVTAGTETRENNVVNAVRDDIIFNNGARKFTFNISETSAPNVPANSSVVKEYVLSGISPNTNLTCGYNVATGPVVLSVQASGFDKAKVVYTNYSATAHQVPSGFILIKSV